MSEFVRAIVVAERILAGALAGRASGLEDGLLLARIDAVYIPPPNHFHVEWTVPIKSMQDTRRQRPRPTLAHCRPCWRCGRAARKSRRARGNRLPGQRKTHSFSIDIPEDEHDNSSH